MIDTIEMWMRIKKVASKWYLKFNTTIMEDDELKEYMNDLELYKIAEHGDKVNMVMKDLYIDYLEKVIEDLRIN